MDTCTFGDDDAAATESAARVIGDVPFGEVPLIGAEIRHVRTEHDAISNRSAADGQRLEKTHVRSIAEFEPKHDI